ncbi:MULTISPECIES: DUF190 domain-containing protein [Streptomyces]|uniref:DUF190 domain-containing protein n=1 Tax=Streptomyces sp. 769 TaxID=1262452 RepID=UPI0005821234|nr:hypothetical protein GZL_00472 [Streptomyces sp. 769]
MRILSLSEELPVAIVIVDDEAPTRAFLARLDDLMDRGVATLDEVDAVHYTSQQENKA